MSIKTIRGLITLCCPRNTQSKLSSQMQIALPQKQVLRELSYYHRYLGQQRPQFRTGLLRLLTGLRSRYLMWKLRFLLMQEFDELEFVTGAKQAATVMIEAVRKSDWNQIRSFSTPQASCAIYAETQNYRRNLYNELVRFQAEHMRISMPIAVKTQYIAGRWYVYVDMAFVGLRNLRDFETQAEQEEMVDVMHRVLENSRLPSQLMPGHQRIVLGEILLTLRRELGQCAEPVEGWLIDFYRMYKFKLVNFSPVTLQYRVIEFLNLFK